MKKYLICGVLVGILLLSIGCPSKEEIARKKEYEADVYKARSIRYRCDYQEVWNAIFSIVAENYSIMRESESKGYIETDWKVSESWGYRHRRKVNVEVLGDSLYRVVIRCSHQSEKGELIEGKILEYEYQGDWRDEDDDKKTADKFYYELYDRLKNYGVE